MNGLLAFIEMKQKKSMYLKKKKKSKWPTQKNLIFLLHQFLIVRLSDISCPHRCPLYQSILLSKEIFKKIHWELVEVENEVF